MKRNGPWQIVSSAIKYTNPWMRVREDKVIRPDGQDGIFGVVEIVSGVSVLPIGKDGCVYLTEEYRYGIQRNSIEAVSGGIDDGEQPIEAARRELQEEIGARAEEWIDLGLVNPLTSVVVSPQRLYVAKGLSWSAATPEGTEQIRLVKLPFSQALQMVKDGEITHAPTCVLLLKAADFVSPS